MQKHEACKTGGADMMKELKELHKQLFALYERSVKGRYPELLQECLAGSYLNLVKATLVVMSEQTQIRKQKEEDAARERDELAEEYKEVLSVFRGQILYEAKDVVRELVEKYKLYDWTNLDEIRNEIRARIPYILEKRYNLPEVMAKRLEDFTLMTYMITLEELVNDDPELYEKPIRKAFEYSLG